MSLKEIGTCFYYAVHSVGISTNKPYLQSLPYLQDRRQRRQFFQDVNKQLLHYKTYIPEDNNNHHHCSMLTVSELSSNKHSPSYYFHYLTMSLTFVCQIVVTKIYACREGFVFAAQPSLVFFNVKVPQVLFPLFNCETHFCFLGNLS